MPDADQLEGKDAEAIEANTAMKRQARRGSDPKSDAGLAPVGFRLNSTDGSDDLPADSDEGPGGRYADG